MKMICGYFQIVIYQYLYLVIFPEILFSSLKLEKPTFPCLRSTFEGTFINFRRIEIKEESKSTQILLLSVKSTVETAYATFRSIASFYHQYRDMFYFGGRWLKLFCQKSKKS